MGLAKLYKGSRKGETLKSYNRKFPLFLRGALEDTFKEWVREKGPKRFEETSFYRYKNLNKSYKRGYRSSRRSRSLIKLEEEIKAGLNTPKPLDKSGELKREFLHGTILFSGGMKSGRLKATWNSLPFKPFYKKRKQISVPDALTEMSGNKDAWFKEHFEINLKKRIATENTKVTFGMSGG